MNAPVLELAGVSVSYRRHEQELPVVRGVDLRIEPGGAVGLVGESGCGKTTVALAIMRYLPENGRVADGVIQFLGDDVYSLSTRRLRAIRGAGMAMVYQDPGSALNPSLPVGHQIAEVYKFHAGMRLRDGMGKAAEMLERVALPHPATIMRRYPHELSGGQQQRVMIAMALAGNPKLLILDEPTTGLDATVEAEVIDLLRALREELRVAILFISHNLSLVATLCAEVAVLYAGRLVETGSVGDVFRDPLHPYTRGLLRCVPRMSANKDHARLLPMAGALPTAGAALPGCQFAPRCPIAETTCAQSEPELLIVKAGQAARCFFPDKREVTEMAGRSTVSPVRAPGPPLMEVTGLSKSYADITACDRVSLHVAPGEILGLVGESGSGKTTLVRCIAGLVQPDAGELAFSGSQLAWRVGRRDREAMRRLQMVFQNPDSTLNPRQGVRYTISRAIRKLGGTRSVNEVASAVRLDAHHLELRASELSGGQRQRVAIARAFAGNPKLVLCDEPVSALDVSVQATILNLLADLADREHVAYIFISHDLSVVHYLADRIAVMYLGQLIEIGDASRVIAAPQHPYTEALFSATPTFDPGSSRTRIRLTGPMPSASQLPAGCRFHTRCPRKLGPICEDVAPPWRADGHGIEIRCHIPLDELERLQASRAPAEVTE